MKVSDIMTHGVAAVTPQDTLLSAAQLMKKHDIGVIPVCDEHNHVVGVLTDRDIVTRAVAMQHNPAQVNADTYMTPCVVCVAPDTDVREAAELMANERVRRLPVLEDGKLVGMLSLGDIAARQHLEKYAGSALGGVTDHAQPKQWPN